MSARWVTAQNPGVAPASSAGQIRQLFTVGDPVTGQNRSFGVAFFNQDPVRLGQGVSVVNRVMADGTLFMSDYAGAALLRFGTGRARIAASGSSGQGQILLDSSWHDPEDPDVGLARILGVATNRDGVSAVLALRADDTYCIYQLKDGALKRLVGPANGVYSTELAISDDGRIAYVAHNASGNLALFQGRVGEQPVEVVSAGQHLALGVVSDAPTDLTSNGTGDLAFIVSLDQPDGSQRLVILRKRAGSRDLELVAQQGDTVALGRGTNSTGQLAVLRRPRIGPEGTVVFQACGGDAHSLPAGDWRNYYVQGAGWPLQPLLSASHWAFDSSYEGWGFEYAVDAQGTVALLAFPENGDHALIYLLHQDGKTELVFDGQPNIQPVGGLSFDASGNLLFLARNPDLPPDRYGDLPIRLYQFRRGANAATSAVQEIQVGQSLGQKPGLFSITQKPVIGEGGVTFGALFGGSERFPVPSGGLVQVGLGDLPTPQATLVAEEADPLPGADRIGIVQDLRYTGDGHLVVDAVLPGGGSAAITLPGNAATASRLRIQAAQPAGLVPLIATGQPLGEPDRKLLNFLGPFVPWGADQQLVTARYLQGDKIGEGLFAISRKQEVKALADTIRGGPNTQYTSFSEASGQSLDAPSVSPEGNIVFWANEDRGEQYPESALFQWLASTNSVVRMLSSYDPTGRGAYQARRWEASSRGTAYVLAASQTDDLNLLKCSLGSDGLAAQVEPLVVPGVTPVSAASPTTIQGITDFATDDGGEIFVSNETETTAGLYRWDPKEKALKPELMRGQPLPRFADGGEIPGVVFGGGIRFARNATPGPLLFRAWVSSKQWESDRRALFRRNAQGALETLLLEGVGIAGARELTFTTLSDNLERQTANRTTAFAVHGDTGWAIYRSRPVPDSQGTVAFQTISVVREGESLPDGRRLTNLNALPLVDGPGDGSMGPIFALNDAGDVAFFASDGKSWGVYEFSDR